MLIEKVRARYEEKETLFGAQTLRWLERHILLDIVDGQWKDHLLTLDHLKEGIGLRGYGQKDPLVEFKKEAFILFEEMMDRIDTEAVRFLVPRAAGRTGLPELPRNLLRRPHRSLLVPRGLSQLLLSKLSASNGARNSKFAVPGWYTPAEAPKPVRAGAKVGRNDPCPCGSGKKYKKCHGQTA